MKGYDPHFEFNPETQGYSMMGPSAMTVAQDMHLAFARDVEGKMRSALIGLGWMPPDVSKVAQAALAEAVEAAVRRGVGVHWDVLTPSLVSAHDAISQAK